jgi:hypothetical protein
MKRKPKSPPKAPRSATFYDGLKELLTQLDAPLPAPTRRPGRRPKNRAATIPVILHLYRSQINWLDQYAGLLAAARKGNARLSRVEVVRGLLLGLAQFALETNLMFPSELPLSSERDLQRAIATGLHRTAQQK